MTDVLIIGAGAAGGIAARRLQQAGFAVVALEQGDWQARADYRGPEWDWELASGKQWSPFPAIRGNRADYPIDCSESDMGILNFNGVGGGTVMYNAIWPRLLPANFRTRSRFGIADDWPLDYAELQPFYEAVDRQVGVSGLGGNPAYPEGAEPPLPAHPFTTGAIEVARVLHRRGWHWWPDTNAILSAPYDDRYQCVRRGTCHTGCNEGAKSSIDVTHWRRFVDAGGRLETGARVRRIVTDDDGLACGAIWIDRSGAEHFQGADIVLCAANGIGTPRLLLASASERFENGLANSSDLVGRNLMLHPLAIVIGLFERQLEGWQGHNGSTITCLEFAQDDARRGYRGGAKWAMHPLGGGPLMQAMKLLAGGTDSARYHDEFQRRLGHGLMWSVMCEDLPDRDNRVVLSNVMKDGDGIPAPKVIYRTSADSRAALDDNSARAAQVFRDAGAWDIELYNPAGCNAHLMGTARMGDDPRSSVVDRWCMSHDIPNLGIIDGSVFVTSGPVNPTSTICALALRAAEHLIANRDIPLPKRAKRTVFELRPARLRVQEAPPAPEPFDTVQLERLVHIGDALIPPVDELPGAGTLLVEAKLLERVLGVRPDLRAPLRRALAAATADTFAALAASDQEAWLAAITVIAGGYYVHPPVMARIGYRGQEPKPQRPDNYPAHIAEGLLDHLLDGAWKARWDAGGDVPSSSAGS
jgi:choline dehydrogenase-like flavoprotein